MRSISVLRSALHFVADVAAAVAAVAAAVAAVAAARSARVRIGLHSAPLRCEAVRCILLDERCCGITAIGPPWPSNLARLRCLAIVLWPALALTYSECCAVVGVCTPTAHASGANRQMCYLRSSIKCPIVLNCLTVW